VSNQSFEYECALTGLTASSAQPDPAEQVNDGLGDLPIGWTRIQISRRRLNPRWTMMQQVKAGMVEGICQQFPPEVAEMQRFAVTVQVDAQFHSLESATPMYVADVDDVVFISDSGEVIESINELRALIGLEPVRAIEMSDDDEEDAEDEEDEEEDDD
jgi:hypothetical protein